MISAIKVIGVQMSAVRDPSSQTFIRFNANDTTAVNENEAEGEVTTGPQGRGFGGSEKVGQERDRENRTMDTKTTNKQIIRKK